MTYTQIRLESFGPKPTTQQPHGLLGSFQFDYINLLPRYKKIVDKILKSKQFKADIEIYDDPGECLRNELHSWGTAVSNAGDYLGDSLNSSAQGIKVLSKNEVTHAANIVTRPYRALRREYWEECVKKQIPEYEYTPLLSKITKLYTPDEVLEMIRAGEYTFSYYPEQLKEWHENNGHVCGGTLYYDRAGLNLDDYIRTDILHTTAVCGYIYNDELYYLRSYTNTAVGKLTKGIPPELKDAITQNKRGWWAYKDSWEDK